MAFTLRDEKPENGLCTTCVHYSHRIMSNGALIKLCTAYVDNGLQPTRLQAPITSCSSFYSQTTPYLFGQLAWEYEDGKFWKPRDPERYRPPRRPIWQRIKAWLFQ